MSGPEANDCSAMDADPKPSHESVVRKLKKVVKLHQSSVAKKNNTSTSVALTAASDADAAVESDGGDTGMSWTNAHRDAQRKAARDKLVTLVCKHILLCYWLRSD